MEGYHFTTPLHLIYGIYQIILSKATYACIHFSIWLATAGIEPTTLALQVLRSTDWATEDHVHNDNYLLIRWLPTSYLPVTLEHNITNGFEVPYMPPEAAMEELVTTYKHADEVRSVWYIPLHITWYALTEGRVRALANAGVIEEGVREK